MGTELLSVLALGEAREALASLRRNARFQEPLDLDGKEHPLVEAIKGVKDIVRAGTVCSNKLDAQSVLEPFLDIVLSSETNSIITAAALHSIEKIVGRGLYRQHSLGSSASRTFSTDALRLVLGAATACRFDPTDPARDEVVLSAITRVVALCLTCGEASHRLSDTDVLVGFSACLKIAVNQRNSELLRRTATATVSDVISYLLSQLADQLQRSVGDGEDVPVDSAQQAGTIYNILREKGLNGLPSEIAVPDNSRPWSINCIAAIFRIVSYLIDPKYTGPSAQKALGISIGHVLLTVTHASGLVGRNVEIRHLIICDLSRAIIRSLASLGQPLSIVAATFGTVQLLVMSLAAHSGPLLSALWLRILPLYATGKIGSHSMDRATREIGLEALGSLFAQKGMLSTAYASIDCNVQLADAVEPLFELLGDVVRETNQEMTLAAATDGKRQEIDDDDGLEDNWVKESRWAAFQSANALLLAADSISDRLRLPNAVILSSPLTGYREVGVETVAELRVKKSFKRERANAAKLFNNSHGKRGARGVAVLLRAIENPDDTQVTANSGHQEFGEGDIEAVVNFFRQTPKLSKEAIGIVLSEPDPVSQRVLTRYSQDFQFRGRSFTDSIRIFLESFRLPGEAQKIDRLMNSFAQSYFAQATEKERPSALVSADAAFVLSFSVVMLNTDQHNTSVKKKMSTEDFVRNNRGINDGADVPKEFLEEIFRDIAAEEIRMSDENSLAAMTDAQWNDALLSARSSTLSTVVCPKDVKELDRDVFVCLWRHAVSASTLLLEAANDALAAQQAMEGFLSVARSAMAYEMTEPTDCCVVALCVATGLVNETLEGTIRFFGSSIKAQMAMVALFGIVRECGDWIRRDGWQSIVTCLVRLHTLCLLPQHFEMTLGSYGTDFVDLDGSHLPPSQGVPRWWPSFARENSDIKSMGEELLDIRTSLFSFLSFSSEESKPTGNAGSMDSGPPAYLLHDQEDQFFADALALSKKCIAECRIDEVLTNEVRFLSSESFECLLSTVKGAAVEVLTLDQMKSTATRRNSRVSSILQDDISARPVPIQQGSTSLSMTGLSEEDDQKTIYYVTAFCIDLLCEVTLRNRDRLSLVWPITHDLIIKTLAPASNASPILERAVVGLLRIAMRFMHREEVRGDVLRALNLLVKLPSGVAASVGTPLSAGVYQIVKSHSVHIATTSGWHTIMSILESCARFPEPAPSIGFQALDHLINNEEMAIHALSPETFAVFLDAVFFYATSSLACSANATDLLLNLATRIATIQSKQDLSDTTPETTEQATWVEYWSPLLLAFTQLCRDDREDIRDRSFSLLESAIRPGGVCDCLSVAQKEKLLVDAMFPLSKDIFDPDGTFASKASLRRRLGESGSNDSRAFPENKARLKTVTIVSRLFLQNLKIFNDHLSSDRLTAVWLGVLGCFRSSLAADSGSGPGLQDHLLEMLKNTVLVAYSTGVLSLEHDERWTKTQAMVRGHIPNIEILVKNASSGSLVTAEKV